MAKQTKPHDAKGFDCIAPGCQNRSPARKTFGGRIAAANDAGWLTWVGRKECDPGDVYCPMHRAEVNPSVQ